MADATILLALSAFFGAMFGAALVVLMMARFGNHDEPPDHSSNSPS